MTIKTIKSSDACNSTSAGTLADRLRTALVDWQLTKRPRKEVNEGRHSGYSSTHNSIVLPSSDILNGTDPNSVTQHSEIKKAARSYADKTHSSTEEHKSNLASSSSGTPVDGDNSVKYQASRAQSDFNHGSTSRSPAHERTRLVAQERQPSSMFDNIDLGIGIGLALACSFLIGTGVGLGVAVVAGVATVLTAGIGSTVSAAAAGAAIGAAAAGSAVGAAVGTGIAAGLDAVTVDAVDIGIDVANSRAIGAAAAGSAVGTDGVAAGLDAVTVDAVVETGIDVANSIDVTR
ncbi:hypothetical protein [Anaplasma bovis]|uniref:hypothetical protein n=1 Tax=Anaplasma bovis TaxID=186733 RepID=UPI002FF12F71